MILLLLACGARAPADDPLGALQRCDDVACRTAVAVDTWRRRPDRGTEVLRALPSTEEQLAVVRALVESGQGGDPALCAALTDPLARDYCASIAARPHLYEAERPWSRWRHRPAGGPVDGELVPLKSLEMSVTEPLDPGCAPGEDATACAQGRAAAHAARCAVVEAGRSCLAVASGKWRSECLFQSAETALERCGAQVYPAASDLCLGAAEYRRHCQAHLVHRLALAAPPGDTAEPADWAPMVATAARLAETWSPRDAEFADLVVGRFWAEATAQAWWTAAEGRGGGFAGLPEEALPHARCALAWRLLELEGQPGGPARDLDGWVARLAEAEAAPGRARAPVRRERLPAVRDNWSLEQVEDSAIPSTWYMGSARRGLAADAQVDRALCLLEATAQLHLADELLGEAETSPEPLVAWTARRLSRGRSRH